jgi:hypothetical protein
MTSENKEKFKRSIQMAIDKFDNEDFLEAAKDFGLISESLFGYQKLLSEEFLTGRSLYSSWQAGFVLRNKEDSK